MLDYVNTILSVKKAYQWKKISLMGHSMGSIVSYIYASLYPETIDLLIQIDIIKNPQRPHEFILGRFEGLGEKIPLEDDRYYAPKEPRLYTFDELVEIIHRGSAKSINRECCKYLIERGCKRSPKDPEKLYFARDPKTKYYLEYDTHHNYHLDFAKRIKNLNHLVIKGSRSKYIGEDSRELIQLIKNQNPNFEFYEVEGTHHVHLNNPVGVAEKIVPFICKYRPEGAEEQNELERVNAKCKL